ncbi:hypothetical protein QUF80_17390 [Desulfococcaceae bacterium HSG8]|nr:hypothetical protein [Desulfococcaceae bacterium HSG8]
MEIGTFLICCLAITKSVKLYGIAEDEYCLKPDFVKTYDILGIGFSICGKQYRVADFLIPCIKEIGYADIPLQCDTADNRRVRDFPINNLPALARLSYS